MRNVQLMKKKIYSVEIRIIAQKNWFTRHETDRFLNNHCQEYVRAYLSIHDCLSFLHEVMIGNHRTKSFLHEVMISNYRNKTTESYSISTTMARTVNMIRICRFLVVGIICRLETCMNSLVKVPPYSKLNFQGKIVFTQNWCNITLNQNLFLNKLVVILVCQIPTIYSG